MANPAARMSAPQASSLRREYVSAHAPEGASSANATALQMTNSEVTCAVDRPESAISSAYTGKNSTPSSQARKVA